MKRLLFVDTSRVSARRPNSFLCFAKERNQRKATADSLPSGVPIYVAKKMGRSETRFAQTPDLLFPFSALHKWLRPKRIKVNNNPNVKIYNKFKNNDNPNTMVDRRHSNKCECGCVDVGFDFAVAVAVAAAVDLQPLGTM
ncbi:hypothetical protein ACO0LM_15330 [Undibacterium sp. Di26W]|uniref:hypothetical protein n=1 Tax=Undibacterium sp. Di26W TaxID=3413035 RepID=UPI003BF11D74